MLAVRLSIFLVLLVAPLRVLAETCTFTTSGNWSAIGTYSGTTTGCTADAGDDFRCSADITVTVTGAITANTTVGADWDFTGCVFDNSGGHTLTAPADGVTLDTGSIIAGLIADGPGAASPAIDNDTPPTTDFARIGRIMYCPGDATAGDGGTPTQDCGAAQVGDAGDTAEILLYWPDAFYDSVTDTNPGERFYPDWIALASVGDRLCFYLPTFLSYPSSEYGHCYEIVDTQYNDVATHRGLVINIEQGSNEPGGATSYVLAERAITLATIQAAAAQGARTITVASTAVSTFARAGRGKYLSCPRADGSTFPGWYANIIQVTDGGVGDDTLFLDMGGARQAVAATDTCFVEHLGLRTGDPVYLVSGGLYVSATAADTDSDLDCTGCTVRNARIDSIGASTFTGAGTALDRIWFTDHSGSGASRTSVFLVSINNTTLSYLMVTGNDAADDDMHGINIDTSTGLTIEHSGCRYHGDDCFVWVDGDTSAPVFVRPHISLLSGGGGSSNYMGTLDASYSVFEGLIVNALADTTAGPGFQCASGSICPVYNVVSIADDNAPGDAELFNWYALAPRIGPTTTPSYLTSYASGCVIRDAEFDGAIITALGTATRGASGCLFIDPEQLSVSTGLMTIPRTAGVVATFYDFGIINPIMAATGTESIVDCGGTLSAAITLRRFLIGFRPGLLADQIDRGLNIGCASSDLLTLDGVAIVNFVDGADADATATAIRGTGAPFAAADWQTSVCLSGNTEDTLSTLEDNFGVTPTRSDSLGLVDPVNDRFDAMPGGLADQVQCSITSGAGVPWTFGMKARGIFPHHDPWIRRTTLSPDSTVRAGGARP